MSDANKQKSMTNHLDVSAVISTYNRCGLLPRALDNLLAQESEGVRYEVIIVDNNSTDQTRQVVESLIERGHSNLHYVFEPQQGVSHARNTGIAHARAPVIAFADDDVIVSRSWVATIKHTFDEHPEVNCIGGKVLPVWKSEPPSWLTQENWSPLALQDYGSEPFYINRDKSLCLVSANLAFRRNVFERIGLFAPELQRVKNSIGSMEDLELLIRFWRAGEQSLYVPDLVVTTEVPQERVEKAYHRRWHKGHGHFYAMMRADEIERSSRRRLFDVPAHLYRQSVMDCFCWLKNSLVGNQDRAFIHESQLRFFAGFFLKRRKDYLKVRRHGNTRELLAFARSLAFKREYRKAQKEVG
jgi:glycosyltransferase involved in cell wall biosynthesis